MQGWSLERKIQVTQTKLIEWYKAWNNQVYVSFSGGKDSSVLADLTARVCKQLDTKLILWFSDTGLEYPEIRQHVKKFGNWLQEKYEIEVETIIDVPRDKKTGKRIRFKDVIQKYGYPIISKEVSNKVYGAKPGNTRWRQLHGEYTNPKTGELSKHFNFKKWKFLLDANFKISDQCCNVLKKRPSEEFEKRRGLKPILGLMASESHKRKSDYLKTGCNAFDKHRPQSQPMGFWKEQDILRYICDYNVPVAAIYGEIIKDINGKYFTTGCKRTGCVFCAYGCHLEKEPNRFQRLKETHPKLWKYCMKPIEEGGLGMKKVLDYIGVKSE